MLMLELFRWWYGPGWTLLARNVKRRLDQFMDMFSVAILLRTLFSPWRRIVTYPGAGLDAHLRAMLDNLISRFVGFFVRVSVLITAVVVFVGLSVVGLMQILLWPLVPILVIACIAKGFM